MRRARGALLQGLAQGCVPHPSRAAGMHPRAGELDMALQLLGKRGLQGIGDPSWWSRLYSCEPGREKGGRQQGKAEALMGLCGALGVTQRGGAGGIPWPLPWGNTPCSV